jgi:hypothetical protein
MAGTPITTSPDVDAYSVFKGIVKWKGVNDVAYRDVGNAPMFDFTPTVAAIDHFSSRGGVKKKDKKITSELSASLKLQLDEMTPENLKLHMMGTDLDSAGDKFSVLTQAEVLGAVRLIGTNDIGIRVQIDFPNVSFTPSNALALIGDVVAVMELTGDVTADENGSFGVVHTNITAEIVNPFV